MQDGLMTVLTICFFIAAFGILKPYRGFARKHFGWATAGIFILMMVVVPNNPDSTKPSATADLEGDEKTAEDAIATKVKAAIESRIEYDRADFEDTYAKIGPRAFARLNELEPGAYYVAAASSDCDMVETGAVSLTTSKMHAPRWFVDCKNGNRFMVSLAEAEQALARFRAGKMEIGNQAPSCTQRTVSECNITQYQKSLSKAEAATRCDMAVEQALIGDSDMDWTWDTRMGEDDEVTIVRGFNAQNAFGANLKHRYVCTLDAATKRIKSLVVEGPMGPLRQSS